MTFSLSPLLRGRDERSSLLECWGEGHLSADTDPQRMRRLPLTPSRATRDSDLSPQAGRGKQAVSLPH
jgi:hypothetical protein